MKIAAAITTSKIIPAIARKIINSNIKSRPLYNYYNIFAGRRTIMAGRLSGENRF
jgi:hypothetical protein